MGLDITLQGLTVSQDPYAWAGLIGGVIAMLVFFYIAVKVLPKKQKDQ